MATAPAPEPTGPVDREEKPVEKKDLKHHADLIDHGGHAVSGQLPDDPHPDQLPAEAEDGILFEETADADRNGDVVAQRGGEPHAEGPAVEDEHAEEIKDDVRYGHGGDRGDKAHPGSGDLHIGDHDLCEEKSRRSEDKADDILPGQAEDRIVRAGVSRAEQARQGIEKRQDQGEPDRGDRRSQKDRYGEAGVGAFPVASADRLAAHHLHAGGDQTAEGGEDQKERTGKPVGAHGVDPQKPADHDAVDQHAEGHGHGGQDLGQEHTAKQFLKHFLFPISKREFSKS